MLFHGPRRRGALVALLLAACVAPIPSWGVETDAVQVDLNRASAAELAALPGIGATKAQAIVDHRTAEPFRTIDDLKQVPGIGDRTYDSLRSSITVSGSAD